VELVIAITIVAIAVTGVLGAITAFSARSADAMVLRQGVAIGEAYLDEILLKPVVDPDGVDTETGRADFDDVDDYDGLVDTGVRDQAGNAIAALSTYTVSVSVKPSTTLTGVPSTAGRRIDVTVTRSPNYSVKLTGFRAAY
jgi:MSHA pilin protein MshD